MIECTRTTKVWGISESDVGNSNIADDDNNGDNDGGGRISCSFAERKHVCLAIPKKSSNAKCTRKMEDTF